MDGKADVLQERHLYHSQGLNRDIHVSQCLRAQGVPKGNLPFFFACLFTVGTVAQHVGCGLYTGYIDMTTDVTCNKILI